MIWLIGTPSLDASDADVTDTMPSAAGTVISVTPIIAPVSQLAVALELGNSIHGLLSPCFDRPAEEAETFLGVVENWAADPNRPRIVYADLTDRNGKTARVTLELGSWSSQS